MRIQSITVGKTRSIKQGKLKECWIKTEISATYAAEEVPTDQEIGELLEEVERILIQQEELENDRWTNSKNIRG